MSSDRALTAATRAGDIAGKRYVRSGFLPRNPWRDQPDSDLAQAWRRAAFAVIGTLTRTAQ